MTWMCSIVTPGVEMAVGRGAPSRGHRSSRLRAQLMSVGSDQGKYRKPALPGSSRSGCVARATRGPDHVSDDCGYLTHRAGVELFALVRCVAMRSGEMGRATSLGVAHARIVSWDCHTPFFALTRMLYTGSIATAQG